MLATAQVLLDEATTIANETPSTVDGGVALVNGDKGDAGRFYKQERAFQDAERAYKTPSDDSSFALLGSDLAQADTFLYNAVLAAVTNCNQSGAEGDLRQVRYDLTHAAKLARGENPPDDEDELAGDDSENKCQ